MEGPKRGDRGAEPDGPVTQFAQRVGGQFEQGFLVVHDEDALSLTRWRHELLVVPLVGRVAGAGKVDRERGAGARLAGDIDHATDRSHDAQDQRQAQSGTDVGFLGREEGIEDPGEDLGRDPGAFVGDLQHDPCTRCHRAGRGMLLLDELDGVERDGQPAPFRHGVHRVRAEVHQELMDLGRISLERGAVGAQPGLQRDPRRQARLQQIERLAHDLFHVHRHALAGPPAE